MSSEDGTAQEHARPRLNLKPRDENAAKKLELQRQASGKVRPPRRTAEQQTGQLLGVPGRHRLPVRGECGVTAASPTKQYTQSLLAARHATACSQPTHTSGSGRSLCCLLGRWLGCRTPLEMPSPVRRCWHPAQARAKQKFSRRRSRLRSQRWESDTVRDTRSSHQGNTCSLFAPWCRFPVLLSRESIAPFTCPTAPELYLGQLSRIRSHTP